MKKFVSLELMLIVTLCLISIQAGAQGSFSYQYAVKFICGASSGKALAPGKYMTAINVHNPTDTTVIFRKKVAVALTGDQDGPVSAFMKHELYADEATEIECIDIVRQAGYKSDFLTGFVVIESNVELDVVSVFTGSGSSGEVEVLDVEVIAPRRLKACPDLIVGRIENPVWDSANKRTIIKATIKNIGNKTAAKSIARVIDPTTNQPTGAPYNAIAMVPALAPGASVNVTFYLPYWVYNPDVTLEVTADYKNDISECSEDNNLKIFEDIG